MATAATMVPPGHKFGLWVYNAPHELVTRHMFCDKANILGIYPVGTAKVVLFPTAATRDEALEQLPHRLQLKKPGEVSVAVWNPHAGPKREAAKRGGRATAPNKGTVRRAITPFPVREAGDNACLRV